MRVYVIVIIVLILLLCAYLIFLRPINNFFATRNFKYNQYLRLKKIVNFNDYYILNNVNLEIENTDIHFDHIIFTNKFIYCINTFYYPLALEGSANDSSFKKYKKNGRFDIVDSPVKRNRTRISLLSPYFDIPENIIYNVTLINDNCLIKEEIYSDHDILIKSKHIQTLIYRNEKYNDDLVKEDEMKHFVEIIYKRMK